jgi:hypothetical protein
MSTKTKIMLVSVVLLVVAAQGAQAGDKWKKGIGTGFFALNLDGDIGLDSTLAGGPVKLDVDLDNSDVSDLMESAFGFTGFAAKDKWRILYGASHLELEGDGSGTVGATPVSADLTIKVTKANAYGVYSFARTSRNTWGALFGLEFTKHDWENDLVVGGVPGSRELDNSWVDGVVGLTHAFDITENVSWSNRAQGGFGGSEGTILLNTGINWHVAKHWMLTFYGQRIAVDYENDNPGDREYYVYDVDEFGAGFGVTYIF